MDKLQEAIDRVRRVKLGEKRSVVYNITPTIVDTVANAWFEFDPVGDVLYEKDCMTIVEARLAQKG